MKLFAAVAVLGLLIVAVGVYTALRATRPSAFPDNSYATRAEAEAKGALAPGAWLPAQIPPGATLLRESHNPNTHQTWGTFHLPAGGEGWRPETSPNQPGEMMLLGAPKNVEWWPQHLRGRASSADLAAQGFRFYLLDKGEPSPLIFGVRGAEVFFWRLARQ